VSERAVQWAIGKLTLDEEFRARFFANPAAAVWETGLPLSPVEVDALSAVPPAALARFSESLHPGLRSSLGRMPTRANGKPDRSTGEVRSWHGEGEVRVSDGRRGA
jgi:hypothetical protein